MKTSESMAMALPMTSSRMALFTVLPDTVVLLFLKSANLSARVCRRTCFRKPLLVHPCTLVSAIHGYEHFRKQVRRHTP